MINAVETTGVELGLNAAIVSVRENEPQILCVPTSGGAQSWDALPFGPFTPVEHRTLEIGLRRWVREQTDLELGYVEQLYTFADRGRHARPGDQQPHVVSIGYLALIPYDPEEQSLRSWRPWHRYFPWEDWREGKPKILTERIEPLLEEWSQRKPVESEPSRPLGRRERLAICFGMQGGKWDEEKVLDRFELLYEAGLLQEAARDGRAAANSWDDEMGLGQPMQHDHRRILATAMGRLRGKLKYRPVVFELLPPEFTLLDLQKIVQAISGSHLHKQNFRRLVESGGLVEPTGNVQTATGGRPAKLFRFRREVLLERPYPGLRVKRRN